MSTLESNRTQPAGRKKKRAKKGRPPPTRADAMREAIGHPLRVTALAILAERVASPREIADLVGAKLDQVSYHVRVLRRLGIIELVEEKKVRGTVAHFYKAVDRPLIDDEEWEALSSEEQVAFINFTFSLLASDLARSLEAQKWKDRPDSHLTRQPIVLDERGWLAVAKILMNAMEQIHAEHMSSVMRMAGETAGEIRAVVGMMIFEMPPAS